MEEIKDQMDINLQRMKILEDFIALSLRRQNIEPEVRKCLEEAASVQKLMQEAHQIVANEVDTLKKQYEKVMHRMQQQQKVIVRYVLKERRRKIEVAEAENKSMQDLAACVDKKIAPKQNSTQQPNSALQNSTQQPNSALKTCSKSLALKFAQINLNQGGVVTPKMTIHEYKESPFVRRTKINPIPISFFEFECKVTPERFESIPKYMRGRESVDCLNNFLEIVIIPCFNEKYKLLHRQRSTVRHPGDMELWKLYNEQVSLVPGGHFITPGDISRRIQKMIDKKSQNRITMLRHLGILQEQRIKSTVCYIWTARTDVNAHNQ